MAKTMRNIVIVAILLIALAAAACFALFTCSAGTPLEGARTSALNTIIDKSGVKDKVKEHLATRSQDLADQYGIPHEVVDMGVDMLAIDDWKVVDTPTDSKVKETVEFDVQGSPVQVTLYDDPSVVSLKGNGEINTFGQDITFSIPESAQTAVGILPYIDAAEDIDLPTLLGSLSGLADRAKSQDGEQPRGNEQSQ